MLGFSKGEPISRFELMGSPYVDGLSIDECPIPAPEIPNLPNLSVKIDARVFRGNGRIVERKMSRRTPSDDAASCE